MRCPASVPPRFPLLQNSLGAAATLVGLAMTPALGAGLPPAPAGAAEQEPREALGRFSDLQPQDWAYQALMDLQQRYGCVAGVPGGAFAGQRSISRFEAAALLLACLDRVEALTDEVQKLLNELQPELARLRARVDGLEARTLSLEARGFSTTTRLGGQVTFVVGGQRLRRQQHGPAAVLPVAGGGHHLHLRRSPRLRHQLQRQGPAAHPAARGQLRLLGLR
jgi:hypothetical protein